MPSQQRQALLVLNDPHSMRINWALAKEIGFEESVVFLQLEYLISISNTKEIDGNLWTYQSLAHLKEEYFPWWHETTIGRILDNLHGKLNLVLYGNYNRNKQDRTRWYAINWVEAAKLKSVRVDESILQNAKWLRRKHVPKRQDELPNISQLAENGGHIANCNDHSAECNDQNANCNDVTLDSSTDSSEIPPETPVSRQNPKPRIFDPSEVWNFVLGQLQPEMGRANFETWVQPIKVREVAGKTFVVEVANGYAREWIVNRLQKRIEHILSGTLGQECQLVVMLPGETRMVNVSVETQEKTNV